MYKKIQMYNRFVIISFAILFIILPNLRLLNNNNKTSGDLPGTRDESSFYHDAATFEKPYTLQYK